MRVNAARNAVPTPRATDTGHTVYPSTLFASLPSRQALNRFVRVTNPITGISILVGVYEVGPVNSHDEDYVFFGQRPQAASGIGLSDAAWTALSMDGTTLVDWEFIVHPLAAIVVGAVGAASDSIETLVRRTGHP